MAKIALERRDESGEPKPSNAVRAMIVTFSVSIVYLSLTIDPATFAIDDSARNHKRSIGLAKKAGFWPGGLKRPVERKSRGDAAPSWL